MNRFCMVPVMLLKIVIFICGKIVNRIFLCDIPYSFSLQTKSTKNKYEIKYENREMMVVHMLLVFYNYTYKTCGVKIIKRQR